MKPYPSSTLIITTYNWSQALALVLMSVKEQRVLPSEVVVADDGSKEETKSLINLFKDNFPVPLLHIWQPDKGFRLAEIRNKAIKKSSGEYIIQIDGDTILHRDFVKNHLEFSRLDTFLTGSRVLLGKRLSIQSQKSRNIYFKWFTRGIKNRLNAMYIPFLIPFFFKLSKKSAEVIESVRGCNMSFWKKDLIIVNGYNQDMTGWGREDSEISVRLVNLGKAKMRIKFGAIQYHQHHLESSRTGLNKNEEILKHTLENKEIKCKNGIVKLTDFT